MPKYKILVFPCGSEIGLEIFRSLKYSIHIELFGASSFDDHGRFIYDNYIGNIPFIDAPDFIEKTKLIVKQYRFDAIYPSMDKVIWKLKRHENVIGCKVIASPYKTTELCLSKKKTYKYLRQFVQVPLTYSSFEEITNFPVFIKPDIGYGSRCTLKVCNHHELKSFFMKHELSNFIISEYLPGEEYTVDCFTDRNKKLRFVGPRIRKRISNGISVNTKPISERNKEFEKFAVKINEVLEFQGAWFFQLKRDKNNQLTLLEVASRLAGSSSLYRGKGINFALLSVFDTFRIDVEVVENGYEIELDRALDNKYKINLEYDIIYVDFDDCLVINQNVNTQLIAFLYSAINNGKKIILLSKHDGDIHTKLNEYKIRQLFNEVIQIKKEDHKFMYIKSSNAIFIDDSFYERKLVKKKLKIPVFSPDMIEVLN